MALNERAALRVTIAGRSTEVTPEGAAAARLEPHGPGAASVVTATGRSRILWTVRPPVGRAPDDALLVEIIVEGWRFESIVEPAGLAALRDRARREAAIARAHSPVALRAPIPGRIGVLRVVEGENVEAGEALLTLEAMKMENVLRAPRAGTIVRVGVEAGQTVELGDVLLELD